MSYVSLSFNLQLRYLSRRHHKDFQPKGSGWEVAVRDDDAVAMNEDTEAALREAMLPSSIKVVVNPQA